MPKISCVTATDCLGIEGSSSHSAGGAAPTVIAHWDGSGWKRARVRMPKGTRSVDLYGVSCPTTRHCVAVGTATGSPTALSAAGPVILIETWNAAGGVRLFLASWNGRKLTVMRPAAPGGGASFLLVTGVSCGTPANCVVTEVVLAADGSTITTLTEVWNGRAWRTATVPWPKGNAGSFLIAVSSNGRAWASSPLRRG